MYAKYAVMHIESRTLDDIRSIIFEEYRRQEITSAENGIEMWVCCCSYLLIIFHLSCVLFLKLNIEYNVKVK